MPSPGPRGRRDLADAVTGLADGGSVTVTGPAGSARPVRLRKARLGGFVPAKHEVVDPVGAAGARRGPPARALRRRRSSSGAHFPLSPEEDAALRRPRLAPARRR